MDHEQQEIELAREIITAAQRRDISACIRAGKALLQLHGLKEADQVDLHAEDAPPGDLPYNRGLGATGHNAEGPSGNACTIEAKQNDKDTMSTKHIKEDVIGTGKEFTGTDKQTYTEPVSTEPKPGTEEEQHGNTVVVKNADVVITKREEDKEPHGTDLKKGDIAESHPDETEKAAIAKAKREEDKEPHGTDLKKGEVAKSDGAPKKDTGNESVTDEKKAIEPEDPKMAKDLKKEAAKDKEVQAAKKNDESVCESLEKELLPMTSKAMSYLW